MGFLSNIKSDTMGIISSLQTLLERYPVLVTSDKEMGKTSFSFMLNLLKIFGITEYDIIEWLSNLLADKKNGADGVLSVIEEAIKVIILTSFKETYTCSIDPMLPDNIMWDIYNENHPEGIEINIEDIDAFGILSNCPTDSIGQAFYFDNSPEDGYNPMNVYSSMDFNAYLWFIVNKGTPWAFSERSKCVWDNRRLYYKKFQKEGCLRGDAVYEEETSKGKFFMEPHQFSPIIAIPNVGPKKEILICEFEEEGAGIDASPNKLRIWLNASRYQGTSAIFKGGNKTIFEFNADYISSLKLFDTKTLLAQIVNAMLGITASISANFSIERNIIGKKVESIVEKIMEEDDSEIMGDNYYIFSNEEYDKLMEESLLNYNGQYQSKNENNDLINVDSEEILSNLCKISSTDDLVEDRVEVISDTIKMVANTLSSTDETPEANKYTFGIDIIYNFLNETITQIVLQVLSPKIIILYAINEKLMNPGISDKDGILKFIKDFENLIVSVIKQVKDIILQELYDYLMAEIQTLITLFTQKLLLETIYYYKILIQQLLETYTPAVTSGLHSPFVIDNVVGADIVPTLTEPVNEDGSRK